MSATPGNGGAKRGLRGWLWAVLRQRCPRCRTGRMFRGLLTMNDPCPVCGLLFQREEGYFLGAMYVSYALSTALLVPLYFAAAALLPGWGGPAVALTALVCYLPFIPAVFRYSRVLWVHLDRAADPDESSAGPYEKLRLKRLAEQQPDRRQEDDK